jgi:hypothetical protein
MNYYQPFLNCEPESIEGLTMSVTRYILKSGFVMSAAFAISDHISQPGSFSVDVPGKGSSPRGGYVTCVAM